MSEEKVFNKYEDKNNKYFDEYGSPIIKFCKNGHSFSLAAESYCPICGEPLITKCSKCGASFRCVDNEDSYCHVCGTIYPWATKRRMAKLLQFIIFPSIAAIIGAVVAILAQI